MSGANAGGAPIVGTAAAAADAAEMDRAREATRLLEAAGIDAVVDAAGPEGEIAAVRVPAERLPAVAAHAAAIRALGFRYVALELAATEPAPA